MIEVTPDVKAAVTGASGITGYLVTAEVCVCVYACVLSVCTYMCVWLHVHICVCLCPTLLLMYMFATLLGELFRSATLSCTTWPCSLSRLERKCRTLLPHLRWVGGAAEMDGRGC